MTVTSRIDEPAQRRNLLTAVPGPRSQALEARRRETVAAGVGTAVPAYVVDSGGGVLVDVDGNTLVDFASGIGVTGVGNAAPEVVRAVRDQVERFTHTCFMVAPYESYVQVCEELADLTPGDHDKRSALFNSGAEAVENAVKVARYATGRQAVVAFGNAYHGRTNLTLALTEKAMPYKFRFGPFAPQVHRAPTSEPYRDPPGMTGEQAARRAIAAIHEQVGADNVAALVVEPIQGEGGVIVPAPGFLPALQSWCTEHGALLVADEVQTGFCRTGRWFGCDHEDVVPDLVATAKGMAGGLPLAALTGRTEVMDVVRPGGLGGTFGGNPIACAAALATIGVMRDQDLAGRAAKIEELAMPRLKALADRFELVGDVRGRGAMLALEIVEPGTQQPDPARTARIAAECRTRGLVILTCGMNDNVVRLLPPLVIPDHVLDDGLSVLEAAIEVVGDDAA